MTSPRASNLRTGLEWGLSFAGIYSGYVLVIALVRGPAVFSRGGTTLVGIVLAYFLGGLAGGALVGLLLPLGRSLLGAALLGFIVAIPVMAAVVMAMWQPEEWFSKVSVVMTAAGLLGPICGAGMWFINQPTDRRY